MKAALRSRHYAAPGQMPGPWTCIEEWRGIDLLAVSAWSSQGRYARVGYEVKVSRADMRAELLRPSKRALNVAWCNAFYLAVPAGLLKDAELAWDEPEWEPGDWHGERCPGFARRHCSPSSYRGRRYFVRVPSPTTARYPLDERIVCPTCNGKGVVAPSRVEREAPQLWIPRDVGLVVVHDSGRVMVAREAPRRKTVPPLDPHELGKLIRWVSMRPDPRHARAA